MTISSEVLRSHAEFVFARCVDGEAVAADMRLAADEIDRLRGVGGDNLTDPIEFEVIGTAVSQGSIAYHPVRVKAGGYAMVNGKPLLRPHHQNPKLKPWRNRIAVKAGMAMGDRPLLTGAVELTVVVCRPRPKAHFNGRGQLKSNMPTHPITRPDTLKLVRAVEDALTGVVWLDDSQIVQHLLVKEFSSTPKIIVSIKEA